MQKITQLRDLSIHELRRVQTTLFDRYRGQANVVDVAFGAAEKDGKPDPSRPDAVCFYVRRKKKTVAKGEAIPSVVKVRLKRGSEFYSVVLPRDVIVLGEEGIQTTGQRVFHRDNSGNPGTAGCVVAWRVGTGGNLKWGVLTVGHIFESVAQGPSAPAEARLRTPDSSLLRGRILAYSRPRDGSDVDAAIVEVSKDDLVTFGLIPAGVSTAGRVIRSADSLMTDRGRAGITIPNSQALDFEVMRVLPVSRSVPALGPLATVIEVGSSSRAFAPGSSGSLWQIGGQAAAIQHGGLPTAFRRGWGQSLESISIWVKGRLAAIHQVSRASIDLRRSGPFKKRRRLGHCPMWLASGYAP